MQEENSVSTIAPAAFVFAGAPLRVGKLITVLLALLACHSTFAARADSCPTTRDEISTDRPDVTNSSLVVPAGSFQIENGINGSARDGSRFVDGTNTRLRAGIANCLEILLDVPTYFANVRGPEGSGFTDVAPALKWQISPIPGKVDLSAVFGVALPTGSAAIAGRGAQPYLQFPWSWELRDGWGLSGMLTEFIRPSDPASKQITETTFVIEKKVTERASLFVEYVGDYPVNGSPAQLMNSGGLYRLTPNQQVDFHVAVGLNHNAPSYIIGIGYSVRFDDLFPVRRSSASIAPRN
ncbi:MAG: transporter [Bradyrhizobium sp.]|nr:transporter [Bradyrhizobium sp.]